MRKGGGFSFYWLSIKIVSPPITHKKSGLIHVITGSWFVGEVNSSYQMLNPWEIQEFFFPFFVSRSHSQFQTTAWTKKSIPFYEYTANIASFLSYCISTHSRGLKRLVSMTDSFASQIYIASFTTIPPHSGHLFTCDWQIVRQFAHTYIK